ncbi:hypothetical protein [Sphingomonas sp.]|uniref:hypothetical protein n=1 Tax=Sphingomonas sp. TaxID=28214 RepID=UPI001B1BBE06|nr:hypothetical protein [Sphingomonas sp.]MBO9713296.1 hypothetical protein [Sphingomonas sp.]
MIDAEDFPTELPADPDGGASAMRWTTGVIGLATAALALLNAGAIASWSEDLSPSPGTAKVMTAADGWQAAMTGLRLDAPHGELHRAWKQAESARWSGDAPPPES